MWCGWPQASWTSWSIGSFGYTISYDVQCKHQKDWLFCIAMECCVGLSCLYMFILSVNAIKEKCSICQSGVIALNSCRWREWSSSIQQHAAAVGFAAFLYTQTAGRTPWKYDARPFTQGAFELNTVNTSKEGLDCQLIHEWPSELHIQEYIYVHQQDSATSLNNVTGTSYPRSNLIILLLTARVSRIDKETAAAKQVFRFLHRAGTDTICK